MADKQLEALMQQIRAAYRGVADLHQQALQTPAPQSAAITSAFEQLDFALEQLEVVEGMLSQQAEALSAASIVVEAWRHHYQDFFDFTPDACLVSDAQGILLEANRAAAGLLNVEQSTLLGRSLTDYIAEGEGPSFQSKLGTLQTRLRTLQTNQEQTSPAWDVVLCPHGRSPFQAVLHVRAIFPTHPEQPFALRWLLRSTAEETREQAQREQTSTGIETNAIETKLMALFHTNIIGIIAGEGDLITEANDCFLRMVGYVREDLPLNWKSLTPLEQHLRSIAAMQEAIATGTASPFEKEFIGNEGQRVPTVVGGYCLQKDPYQFINFVLDITERKQWEAKIAADYTREHKIAETFQRALLPDVSGHSFLGLTVTALYAAAWEEAHVGGDFYDAFALEDGKTALVVGDVAGKGLAAAVYAFEIKSALRGFLREHPNPATALTRLNAFVYDHLHLDTQGEEGQGAPFTTLALAVVEADSGKVTFAVAGAEPPLLIRVDGTMEVVNAGSLMLGVKAQLECEATEVTLHPGDRLLMVTDGITEARAGADFLDYDGLVALAEESLSRETLQEMVQAILDGARAFAGGTLADDACLLVAYRTT